MSKSLTRPEKARRRSKEVIKLPRGPIAGRTWKPFFAASDIPSLLPGASAESHREVSDTLNEAANNYIVDWLVQRAPTTPTNNADWSRAVAAAAEKLLALLGSGGRIDAHQVPPGVITALATNVGADDLRGRRMMFMREADPDDSDAIRRASAGVKLIECYAVRAAKNFENEGVGEKRPNAALIRFVVGLVGIFERAAGNAKTKTVLTATQPERWSRGGPFLDFCQRVFAHVRRSLAPHEAADSDLLESLSPTAEALHKRIISAQRARAKRDGKRRDVPP